MTSRIRSKGSSEESSRRPTIRVRRRTKKNAKRARRTMSIRARRSRRGRREKELLTVVELDVLRARSERCGIDLEVEVEAVVVADRDAAELERDAASLLASPIGAGSTVFSVMSSSQSGSSTIVAFSSSSTAWTMKRA